MKTIHSRILSALAILSTAILLPGANAQTASTVPVGFISTTLAPNTTSPFGVPLQDVSVFAGSTSQVTANTFTVAGVNWTVGQFAAIGAPHFVTITSGAQTGRTLLVTANTATTLTVDVGDTDLNAAGFTAVAGNSVDLVQGDTLGSFFGTTANAGVLPSGLQGAGSLLAADTVQIYNGLKFVAYFFNTTVGNWVVQNGGTANQNDTVLFPDRGLLISRKQPTSATLTLIGRVPSTGLLTKVPGNTNNVISLRFPTDSTLGALAFSGPGTWNKGTSVLNADTVQIWNGLKWVAYFQSSATNQWLKQSGDGSDQSGLVIPVGTAILIGKKAGGVGSTTFYSQALPYSVN